MQLPGLGCVKRAYTDLAIFECTSAGLKLIDKMDDLEFAELQRLVGLPLFTQAQI